MPRQPRIEIPGLTYHVTSHGLQNVPLFRDAEDRDTAVRLLRETVERSQLTCVE